MKKNTTFFPLALYLQSKQTNEISINNTLNMLDNNISDIFPTDTESDAATLFHLEKIIIQYLPGFITLTGNLSSEPVTGDLVFDGKATISDISLPVNNSDAVSLKSISLTIQNCLSFSGTNSENSFTGNIYFNNTALVTGLADPVNDSDAVNLQTMQFHFSGFLPLLGGNLSGSLDMNNYSLTGLPNSTQTYEATNLSTFNSLVHTSAEHFVPLKGTSTTQPITGNVTLQNVTVTGLGTAISDSDAMNLSLLTDTLNTYILKSGSTLEGDLNLNNHPLNNLAAPVQDDDLVNKIFLDTYGESFVKLSGDTLTGSIAMSTHIVSNLSDPLADTDGVNFRTLQTNLTSFDTRYVPFSGTTLLKPVTGTLVFLSQYTVTGLASPTENTDIVNLQTLNTKLEDYFPLKGGSLQGNINAKNFSFSNLADPIHPNDTLNFQTLTRLAGETISLYIPLSGTNSSQLITGNVVLNSEIISLLPQAKNPDDIVTSQDCIDIFSKKLILSGDALSGNLDMSLQKIINLADPVNSKDALNLQTVTSRLQNFFPLSGGIIKYRLDLGNSIISDLADPVNDSDAVNLKTLQELLKTTENDFIPLSGNDYSRPVTGHIIFDTLHLVTGLADPVNDSDAINFRTLNATAQNYLPLKGGHLSDNIDMNSLYSVTDIPDISNDTEISLPVNRTTLSERIAIYFPLSGSSLSGPLNMQGHGISDLAEPINPTDAVTLGYLNSHLQTQITRLIPLSGNTTTPITGNIVFDSLHLVTGLADPVNDSDAVNLTTLSKEFAAYMPLSGSALQGTLHMGNYKIINLADPVNDSDAVTLAYTQQQIMKFVKNYVKISGAPQNDPVTGNFVFDNMHLVTGLTDPVNDSDVVNLQTLTKRLEPLMPLSGSALQGTLHMGSQKIVNLADPVNDSDAVTLSFSQTLLLNTLKKKIPLSGTALNSPVTGNIDAGNTFTLTNLSKATENSQPITFGQLKAKSALYLSRNGGKLSGILNMSGFKITGLKLAATSFQLVNLKNLTDSLENYLKNYLPLSGTSSTSALQGNIFFNGTALPTGLSAPQSSSDVANFATLVSKAGAYLPVTGGVLTGPLSVTEIFNLRDASVSTSAVPFKQAENLLNSKILPLSGNTLSTPLTYNFIFDNSHVITGLSSPVLSTDAINFITLKTKFSSFLPLSGGNMSGLVNANNQIINYLLPKTQKNPKDPLTLSDIQNVSSTPFRMLAVGGSNINQTWFVNTNLLFSWSQGLNFYANNSNQYYEISADKTMLNFLQPGQYLFKCSIISNGATSTNPFIVSTILTYSVNQSITLCSQGLSAFSSISCNRLISVTNSMTSPYLHILLSGTSGAQMGIYNISYAVTKLMD